MVTENAPETNRPYGPPSNVISVLQRLRSRNLPGRIDAGYLQDAGVSEGTVGRTLFALRFLGLIGDNAEPTQALRAIQTSTDEEYRTILAGLIRDAYVEVFNVVDPAEDSQDRILNVFRRYTPTSQRTRMVVFFLGMCREAGIATLDVPRQRPMREPRAPREPRTRQAAPPASRRRADQISAGPSDIHPALVGLVRSLPPEGTVLSPEKREQWLTMARGTLDFIYPSSGPTGQAEEEEGNGE